MKGITASGGVGLVGMMALIALYAFAVLAASAQQDIQADLSVTRTIQSAGLLPAAGEYVRYDLAITNTGSSAIEGQKLWVGFAPAQGEGTSAVFAVPDVAPGNSTQLHLGPFKLHEPGEHLLMLGMNREGNPDMPDDVALNVAGPADAVTAYSPAIATALPAGIALVAAGAGFIGWFLVRRKKA